MLEHPYIMYRLFTPSHVSLLEYLYQGLICMCTLMLLYILYVLLTLLSFYISVCGDEEVMLKMCCFSNNIVYF